MRRLLLLALVGMGLSKMYFGSFVPPNLKLNAPGFDILRGNSNARPPPLRHAARASHPSFDPSLSFLELGIHGWEGSADCQEALARVSLAFGAGLAGRHPRPRGRRVLTRSSLTLSLSGADARPRPGARFP